MLGAILPVVLVLAAFLIVIAIGYRAFRSRSGTTAHGPLVRGTTGDTPSPKALQAQRQQAKTSPRGRRPKNSRVSESLQAHDDVPPQAATTTGNEIYLDIETQRLSYEVPGGWSNIENFGLSIAVTWDLENNFRVWTEDQIIDLISELQKFARIVTYNGDRFDMRVLGGYATVSDLRARSFDVLAQIRNVTGRLVSLDHVCGQTLGAKKSGDGIAAVRWWREGKIEKVATYCRHDVELLIRLVSFGRENGYVLIDRRQVKVNWVPSEVLAPDLRQTNNRVLSGHPS